MYCINCGATVEETSIFCTNCGKRIKADPVVTIADEEAQNTVSAETAEPVITAEEPPVQPVNSYTPPVAEPVVPPAAPPPMYNEQPVMPVIPEKQQPEKVYFGKGALAFCLVVIALLAISTGVFAGLYFAAI